MITIFSLLNEYGQSYTLNDLRSGYLTAPEGMGYEISNSYVKIGNTWVPSYSIDKQKSMSATIVFATGDPYTEQTALLKFIRTSKKLRLCRKTSAGEYYKDVDLTKYDISRIKGNSLSCPISLMSKSLWYANSKATYQITARTDEAYMKYSYKFPTKFSGSVEDKISVINDGSVDAPMQVSFVGPIVNPSLTLLLEGEEVARINIVGEAAVGESIEYSTVDGDLYCYTKKANENVNLANSLSLENDNFFKIPVGTYDIKVSADAEIVNPVIFNIRKLYRAV